MTMSAEKEIRELAGRHGVTSEPPDLSTPEHRWIARFSSPPNELGEADWLLINLNRLSHVSDAEFERLYGQLVSERDA